MEGEGTAGSSPTLPPCGQLTRCFSAVAELLVNKKAANSSDFKMLLLTLNQGHNVDSNSGKFANTPAILLSSFIGQRSDMSYACSCHANYVNAQLQ